MAWAQENLDRDWDNVIFSDVASFWAYNVINRAWSIPINRLIQRTVKRPVKVHVWSCFSKRGFGTLHLFTENLNVTKMVKIYERALLPCAQRWFGRRREN
jgi:hypothetical protein